MPEPANRPTFLSPDTLRWSALILVTVLITLMFFGMIRSFLISLVMAAIVAELSRPLYRRIRSGLWGRRNLAAAVTVLLVIVLVIIPVVFIASVAAEQAFALSRSIVNIVNTVTENAASVTIPDWVPYQDSLDELGPEIANKIADLVTALARFTVSTLSQLTRGTALFFLDTFIFLYALFFFLQMETPVMKQILRFTGLTPTMQRKIADRAVSVSRATIKGTLVIGVVQGVLGGIGFYLAGIQGPTFWGVVMGILSIIPGIGPSLVLAIGVIYLAAIGHTGAAIGLGLWAGLVVTTIDNILRPILVGRDTQMHDILILVSTFGGLGMFGAVGLILGPVVAGLFVTIWTTLSESMLTPQESEEDRSANT
ncbi:AI-2E family transporter [Aliiruegeria lutimaris]|uniref:Predicted PurR-regulated permease PerM n=1 Tax=Aliiruegeria lutimaris TaxID=571298 RepID=A0A1G8LBU1_9RHOB|nr:AI-2E family transporter [Aliiruegeria lutimaris]SDI53162.1 Predicted PurR-regulated permease PerM [Aliiruegeria lutimaris]